MKKFLLTLFTVLSTLSCTKVDVKNLETQHDISSETGMRPLSEIEDIAVSSIATFSSESTKSSERLISAIIPFKGYGTKSTDNSVLFYIVNFGNNDGFVLVGATKSSPEVIAFSDKGTYNGESTDNEGFDLFQCLPV